MQSVTIFGPNLPVQGPTFHVHAAKCADLARGIYPRLRNTDAGGWDINARDVRDVVEAIYDDMIEESGGSWDDPAYLEDIKIFPCVVLPDDEGQTA